MVIYGINAVIEALRADRVREIRIAGRADDRVRAVIEDATKRGLRIRHVTREALDAAADGQTHQGIVADVTPLPPATLEDLARQREGADPPLIVVLDSIEDPQNV